MDLEDRVDTKSESFQALADFLLTERPGGEYVFMVGDGTEAPADCFKWSRGKNSQWVTVYVRRGESKVTLEKGELYAVPKKWHTEHYNSQEIDSIRSRLSHLFN